MTNRFATTAALVSIAVFFVTARIHSTTMVTNWNPVAVHGVNAGKEQTASLILDIDQDGIQDFVLAERTDAPSVAWYKRIGGTWRKHLIETAALPVEAGGAHYDIDGDGDLDVVFGGDAQSNEIWWWENPYPKYDSNVPWNRYLIKASGKNKHHDSMFGDFDGDGRAELVTWNQGSSELLIADIPADPKKSPWSLAAVDRMKGAEGLTKEDIDGDGMLDIVGGGSWYKYYRPGKFERQVIDASQKNTRVVAGQFIPGGYSEVVFAPGDVDGKLNFYQWTGSGWVKTVMLQGATVIHGHSLRSGDINKDGHLDIFIAEMGRFSAAPKMRLLFGNGKGGFQEQIVSSTHDNHESRLGDLDGDGDLDILQKPYDTPETPGARVWINTSPISPDNWQRFVIDGEKPWKSIFILHGDLDGDGNKDIATGGWWYKNPGKPSGDWKRRNIGAPLNNVAAVHDFDQDGDLDILGTQGKGSSPNHQFAWARNDGNGRFTILTNIDTGGTGDFLQGVAVDRFSDSVPLEVALSWHNGGGGVQMLSVPDNPSTETWAWRTISSITQREQLSSGDIDRDGDKDLLLGTQWLRNDEGSWSAFKLNKASGLPDRSRLADINKDGRMDAVVGYEAIGKPGKLAWYEQPAVATGLWTEHVIADNVKGPMSLDLADMNHDGRPDVVTGEHNLARPSDASLYIFENAEDTATIWHSHTVYTGDEHHDGAQVVDIDNDGDFDILSIGWSHGRVLLYENKKQQP
ncbi:MAG: FG-GAP repeat domain-containing protein [Gammaproteobacteria bacterium]